MTVTLEDLERLLDGEGLRYSVGRDPDTLSLGLTGFHGNYVLVVEPALEGRYVRVRTLRYAFCCSENQHMLSVLRLLAELNYQMSGIKFGWDPSDGEIDCTVEATVEDAELTQQQFHAMLCRYLPQLDLSFRRLLLVIETGEVKPDDLPGSDGLPPALRRELDEFLDDLTSGDGDG